MTRKAPVVTFAVCLAFVTACIIADLCVYGLQQAVVALGYVLLGFGLKGFYDVSVRG